MYSILTQHLSRLLLLEMRRFWSFSPQYPDLVGSIQGKYSFRERPQQGIILQNVSSNVVPMAADNFMGTVSSYVTLANVQNFPGMFLEWVREDVTAIQRNGGVFPSAPGVYYIEIQEVWKDRFTFHIDALLDVHNDYVCMVNETTGRLSRGAALNGSLRLYLAPGDILLKEGVNYTVDYESGLVYLLHSLADGDYLVADYRHPATAAESPAVRDDGAPWVGLFDRALVEPLPGVVLAFGRRVAPGDVMAVVVNSERDYSALEYGGRWDTNVDIEVFARDVMEQRDIKDQTATYLWGVLRSRLSSQGIEMSNLSIGGESEEPYNDVGDSYFYTASLSFTVQSDWSIQVPVTKKLIRAETADVLDGQIVAQDVLAQMSLDERSRITSGLQMLDGLGLRSYANPYKSLGTERIS